LEQQTGQFCTLEKSGDGIFGQVQTGIPIFEGVSSELISLFLKLKNDWVYDKEVLTARPESQCQVESRGEGSALSISQLTGIWVVSFGFAFFGLLVTFLSPLFKRCKTRRSLFIMSLVTINQETASTNLNEATPGSTTRLSTQARSVYSCREIRMESRVLGKVCTRSL
jgi:hypothetical protein